MATQPVLTCEIQQSDGSWTDCVGDVQTITTSSKIGLHTPSTPNDMNTYPDESILNFSLRNTSGTYTPAVTGIGTGRIDNNRRVRLRYAGTKSNKALQTVLTGPGGVGGSVNTNAGLLGSIFGPATGWVAAQSIVSTNGGLLSQVTFGAFNAGTVTLAIPYSVYSDNANKPGRIGTLLTTGVATSANTSGSRTCTSNISSGPYLTPGQTVWIVITTLQDNNSNFFGVNTSATSTYANGFMEKSLDGGVTWATDPSFADMQATITTASVVVFFSQVVTTAVATSDVWTLTWDARAQWDSQYNNDSVNIVTSSQTGAATGYTYTNKWVTYTLTFTATSNATTIAPQFAPQLNGSGTNNTAIEYRNITLIKSGGSNVLTNGNFATGAISPWTATSAGGTTVTISVVDDMWIVFNGKIGDLDPDAQLSNISPLINFDAHDWVRILKMTQTTLPLQKNFTSDSISDLALAVLPSGTLDRTLPGAVTDAGRSTFLVGGDTYTSNKTSLLQIINQAVISELSRCWQDRDGTVEVHNRDYVPLRTNQTPKLTLADGVSGYQLEVRRAQTKLRNDIIITSHARVTAGSATTVGKMDQPFVYLPAARVNANGSVTPSTVTITLTLKDSAGNLIGADSVITPLVGGTDYTLNAYEPGNPASVDITSNADFSTTNYIVEASQLTVTFQTIGRDAHINMCSCRGQTVTTYNPATIEVTDATSITKYDVSPWNIDMPFQTDQALLTNYANYLLSQYKYPYLEAIYFECQNVTIVNGVDVMGLEIGDVISVSDSRTGLSSVKHMAVGFEYDWTATNNGTSEPSRVRVYMERLDQQNYWQAGIAGFSEAGLTTVAYI